jgi:hypothetical protein
MMAFHDTICVSDAWRPLEHRVSRLARTTETRRRGTMSKSLVGLATLLTVMLAVPASAGLADEVKMTVDVILEHEEELVLGALELTDEQEAVFVPMFRDYKADIDAVMTNRINLIRDFMEKGGSLTEERAEEMIRQFYALGEMRLEIRSKWAKKFQKVLPAVKVVRLIQIENKIESLVELKLAEAIPLAT